jgi:hypothetical protein
MIDLAANKKFIPGQINAINRAQFILNPLFFISMLPLWKMSDLLEVEEQVTMPTKFFILKIY